MAHILVIEDNPDQRALLVRRLASLGHEVTTAGTGSEGHETARKEKPDLIIIDVMIPDTNGLDVCKALKSEALTAHIPILILTAMRSELIEKMSFSSGADDFLGKPWEAEHLNAKVQHLLRKPGQEPKRS